MLRGPRFAAVIVPALARYRWLEWRDARTGTVDDAAGPARTSGPRRGFARLGEDLGGIYVKLCQVAGARADVFPPVFVRELGRFHDRVPPRPFAELAPTLGRELGRPVAEVFAHVEPAPLAAASLAQVHRATLRDGYAVVLKIQYPEAARLFAIDLGNVRRGVAVSSRLFTSFALPARGRGGRPEHRARARLRARARPRSSARARTSPAIRRAASRAPTPSCARGACSCWSTSTARRSTTSSGSRADGVDLPPSPTGSRDLYRRMIFEHGFFHGDPHPGNLLVLRDGRIGLLDFGLAKELPAGFGANLAQMFASALARRRGEARSSRAKALGFSLDGADPEAFLRAAQHRARRAPRLRRAARHLRRARGQRSARHRPRDPHDHPAERPLRAPRARRAAHRARARSRRRARTRDRFGVGFAEGKERTCRDSGSGSSS